MNRPRLLRAVRESRQAQVERAKAALLDHLRTHVGQGVSEHCARPDCGGPVVAAYPARGGGFVALCALHAEPHADICLPVWGGITHEPPYIG